MSGRRVSKRVLAIALSLLLSMTTFCGDYVMSRAEESVTTQESVLQEEPVASVDEVDVGTEVATEPKEEVTEPTETAVTPEEESIADASETESEEVIIETEETEENKETEETEETEETADATKNDHVGFRLAKAAGLMATSDETLYKVTVKRADGSIFFEGEYGRNADIMVVAYPVAPGKKFVCYHTDDGRTLTPDAQGNCTFQVYDKDLILTGEEEEEVGYKLTILIDGKEKTETRQAGEQIVLPNPTKGESLFVGWGIRRDVLRFNKETRTTTFEMPEWNTTCTAVFQDVPYYLSLFFTEAQYNEFFANFTEDDGESVTVKDTKVFAYVSRDGQTSKYRMRRAGDANGQVEYRACETYTNADGFTDLTKIPLDSTIRFEVEVTSQTMISFGDFAMPSGEKTEKTFSTGELSHEANVAAFNRSYNEQYGVNEKYNKFGMHFTFSTQGDNEPDPLQYQVRVFFAGADGTYGDEPSTESQICNAADGVTALKPSDVAPVLTEEEAAVFEFDDTRDTEVTLEADKVNVIDVYFARLRTQFKITYALYPGDAELDIPAGAGTIGKTVAAANVTAGTPISTIELADPQFTAAEGKYLYAFILDTTDPSAEMYDLDQVKQAAARYYETMPAHDVVIYILTRDKVNVEITSVYAYKTYDGKELRAPFYKVRLGDEVIFDNAPRAKDEGKTKAYVDGIELNVTFADSAYALNVTDPTSKGVENAFTYALDYAERYNITTNFGGLMIAPFGYDGGENEVRITGETITMAYTGSELTANGYTARLIGEIPEAEIAYRYTYRVIPEEVELKVSKLDTKALSPLAMTVFAEEGGLEELVGSIDLSDTSIAKSFGTFGGVEYFVVGASALGKGTAVGTYPVVANADDAFAVAKVGDSQLLVPGFWFSTEDGILTIAAAAVNNPPAQNVVQRTTASAPAATPAAQVLGENREPAVEEETPVVLGADRPGTGDEANVIIWLVTMVLAAAVIVWFIYSSRKKENENE